MCIKNTFTNLYHLLQTFTNFYHFLSTFILFLLYHFLPPFTNFYYFSVIFTIFCFAFTNFLLHFISFYQLLITFISPSVTFYDFSSIVFQLPVNFYATNASSKNSCEKSLLSPLIMHEIYITPSFKVKSSLNSSRVIIF